MHRLNLSQANALIDAAEEDERVFVLDCDLVSSIGDASFVKRFPARTINCGIQEANACAFAAGMSSRGFIPFFHSFGVFASRRITDQLYISCAYAGLNVKIGMIADKKPLLRNRAKDPRSRPAGNNNLRLRRYTVIQPPSPPLRPFCFAYRSGTDCLGFVPAHGLDISPYLILSYA